MCGGLRLFFFGKSVFVKHPNVYSSELIWFVCNNFLHCYYTYMLWSDASHVTLLANFDFCSYAYALNINRCFGSPFWQLGVPIGSLFHKKVGSLFQSLGVLISFGGSAIGPPLKSLKYKKNYSTRTVSVSLKSQTGKENFNT